ncbi:MAG: sialate O-acetylesterase [Clostridia bacterium]|nr:sialate O-acetylesterase [Clostridia bacterium]
MNRKIFRNKLIPAICLVLSLGTLFAAGCGQETGPAETSDDSSGASSASDGTEPSDPTADEAVTLASLTLSDGTDIGFEPAKRDYTVSLPAGHPRVPQISAVPSDGNADAELFQATLASGETEGIAAAVVTCGDKSATYTVKFTVDASEGFELQYDDRYQFRPSSSLASGEAFTFRSSDESVLSVSSSGLVTAKKVSDTPVVIEALVGDTVRDTLTVTRVRKAGVALFLVIGQSNAWGSYDSGETTSSADSDKPSPGISYYINANDGTVGRLTDLSGGRTGFGPALGKQWYSLTGEKSLLLHTAISGSPIECWLKNGDRYSGKGNGYDNTVKALGAIKKQYFGNDGNYEIIRTGAFWCQGETGQVREWTGSGWNQSNPKIQGSEDYYGKFMTMYKDLKSDTGIEFFSILMVRALKQTVSAESLKLGLFTDLIPVRAAQYTIEATTDSDLIIASRLTEIARKATDPRPGEPGGGWMGPESVHHTQFGYNAEGKELADNTFRRLSAKFDHTPTELEVLAPDGRTRLADGDTVRVEQGGTCQLAAIVLPLWNTDPMITSAITSGSEFGSVDSFSKVTVGADAPVGSKLSITFTADCGLKKTVQLEVTAKAAPSDPTDSEPEGGEITLHWDFNNLSEENGYSDLTLSSRSGSGDYKLEDGKIILGGRNTDFVLAKPFFLAQNFDWSIEWRGLTTNSSALFGTDYSKNDFIYAAFCTSSWNYPFRMVSSTGTAAMIPYGSYADKNREMNTWKIEYKKDTRQMTLYFMGSDGKLTETVGSYTWSGDFTFNITNMFGRFASGSTLVCWTGEMDYITVMARSG